MIGGGAGLGGAGANSGAGNSPNWASGGAGGFSDPGTGAAPNLGRGGSTNAGLGGLGGTKSVGGRSSSGGKGGTGATAGTGAISPSGGSGAGGACQPRSVKGRCYDALLCNGGAWETDHRDCVACGVVSCESFKLGQDCCAGWLAAAYVNDPSSGNFLPDATVIASPMVSRPDSVSVDFAFGPQLLRGQGDIGALVLRLPGPLELSAARNIQIEYDVSDSSARLEMSFERGEVGVAYAAATGNYSVETGNLQTGIDWTQSGTSWPSGETITLFDSINIRVRPSSSGVVTLTVYNLTY